MLCVISIIMRTRPFEECSRVFQVTIDGLNSRSHTVFLYDTIQRLNSLLSKEAHTDRICSPTSFARAICLWSVVAVTKASARFSTVSLRTLEPMPRASTRSAQKNWSPKKGLIIVGIPANDTS